MTVRDRDVAYDLLLWSGLHISSLFIVRVIIQIAYIYDHQASEYTPLF